MISSIGSKILKSSLVFSLILTMFIGSSNFASADSGESALPPKDSALHEYYYKLYAPKKQKTYKQIETATQPVSQILKENSDLTLYGGALVAGGTLSAQFKAIENLPYVGVGIKVANGVGSAMILTGTFGTVKYRDFVDGSEVKHKLYFKWTNTAKLEYDVKIESWVEYKGKKVSKVKTSYFSKSL